ncbi:MAG: GNAT family N-acetyltransferase [Candidatus Thorarchaeota archaeon]|nr:GNAT family N-acetyltransferase [Candidatus Thorarchaeota archaeon]
MNIRPMLKQDIDFALHLTSCEGWGSIALDFEELLAFDSESCFILEINEESVGMICTIPYDGFGFISNLIVLKEHRNRGLGAILMKHALGHLEGRGARSHLLDGVLKAVPLYERFGFERRYKSLRLEGRVAPRISDDIREMVNADLNDINGFDAKFFGASRKDFLESRLKHFPSLCKVLEIDGYIEGYIMGSERRGFIRIGPWVMKTHSERAEALLQDFSSECEEMPLRIGILENNEGALHILQKHGFAQKSYSWRMIRGVRGSWTFSDHLYAIHSAARG